MARCKGCGEEVIFKEGRCPICGFDKRVVSPSRPLIKEEPPVKKRPLEEDKVSMNDNSSVAERCLLSVCLIEGGNGEETWHGTGWYAGRNIIVTNAHVVLGKTKNIDIMPSFLHGKFYGSEAQINLKPCFISVEEDIALLQPDDCYLPPEIPSLRIRQTPVKLGEAIFTIGNPLHYKFTYKEGAVGCAEYDAPPKKYPVIQTTIDLNGGNSGGPVFDKKGQIVGMASFNEMTRNNDKLEAVIGYGFAVSAKAILAALSAL